MLIRNGGLKGGYVFKNFSGLPNQIVSMVPIPEKVIIPLKQGFGEEIDPIVEKGDSVNAGDIVAHNDEVVSSPIHSSVSGTVEDLVEIDFFGEKIKGLVIKSNGTSEWISPVGGKLEIDSTSETSWDTEELEKRMYFTGVTSLGNHGIPTRYKSSFLEPEEVKHFVIDALDADVYDPPLSKLLTDEKISNFSVGISVLGRVFPETKIHIIMNKKERRIAQMLKERFGRQGKVNIHLVESRYPFNLPPVLASIALDVDLNPHSSDPENGVIALRLWDVLSVYEGAIDGKPLIERVVALCGEGYIDPHYARVRVGTSYEDLIGKNIKAGRELRFVLGSPLWGRVIEDLSIPVDRTVTTLVSLIEGKEGEFVGFAKPGFTKDSYSKTFVANFLPFKKHIDTNLHGEARPCIFCGYCEDVCPVDIVPHLIAHYVERDMIDDYLVNYKIFDCIGCNLCTYVCPSKIEISTLIQEGKNKLDEIGIEDPLITKRKTLEKQEAEEVSQPENTTDEKVENK